LLLRENRAGQNPQHDGADDKLSHKHCVFRLYPDNANMTPEGAQCDEMLAQSAARLAIRLSANSSELSGMSLAHHSPSLAVSSSLRHDWTREEVRALFALPFPELMFRAAQIHRENFDPSEVQISTLLSIKTGGCPEDCAYCPQSAKFNTEVKAEKLMDLDVV